MVVKAAEDRLRCDGADALNRAMKRGVLVQRSMSPQLIIIGGETSKLAIRVGAATIIGYNRAGGKTRHLRFGGKSGHRNKRK
jgi:hypothetical protein